MARTGQHVLFRPNHKCRSYARATSLLSCAEGGALPVEVASDLCPNNDNKRLIMRYPYGKGVLMVFIGDQARG